MTITVETGSGTNAAANSYASVATLQAYAEARGYTLPDTDAGCELLLIKAMDYIESRRSRFQGIKTSSAQPLQWPREWVIIDGYAINNDAIPTELIKAQCELAVAAYTIDLQPTLQPSTVGQVKSKRIEGAVSIDYFESAASKYSLPQFTAANGLLDVVCKPKTAFMVRA